MVDITTLYDGIVFPECPRWRGGSLWFADCHDGKVLNIAADGKLLESFDVPGNPAGLGWLPDGDMLIVSIDQLCIFRRRPDNRLTRHADLAPHHRFHANDMVVDRDGNAYVGEVGFRAGQEEPRTTSVLLVTPDGGVSIAATDVLTPNGSVITPDGKTFILAESMAKRLTAFTIAENGTLVDPQVFAQLGPDQVPDGICLDEDGCIWIASPRTASVIRVAPGGKIVDELRVERGRPYACMLGGANGRDLFICVSTGHDPALTRPLRGGAIVVAQVGSAGCGFP
jgi:sugar lactone lactonase YvrE